MITQKLGGICISYPPEHNHFITPTPCKINNIENSAAIKIQSFFRGEKVRKSLSIKMLEVGVIKVEISNAKIIREMINTDKNSITPENNQIIYFSLDQRRFQGRIRAHSVNRLTIEEKNDENINPGQRPQVESIMINGGYYNYQHRASDKHDELATIGRMVADNIKFDHLPVPENYKHVYGEINFPDGSLIESAPVLTTKGVPVFLSTAEKKYRLAPDFSFEKNFIVPGELQHAADRNPRAAISLPESRDEGTVRIVTCISKKRGAGGMTLPEWSRFLARIDKISTIPSSSINLDGGGSVRIIATLSDGTQKSYSQNTNLNQIANYIEFVKK
jgi:hypothetical protein